MRETTDPRCSCAAPHLAFPRTTNAERGPGQNVESLRGDVDSASIAHSVTLLVEFLESAGDISVQCSELVVGFDLHQPIDGHARALPNPLAERDIAYLVGRGRHAVQLGLEVGLLRDELCSDGVHVTIISNEETVRTHQPELLDSFALLWVL
jgi:hypothetical protein